MQLHSELVSYTTLFDIRKKNYTNRKDVRNDLNCTNTKTVKATIINFETCREMDEGFCDRDDSTPSQEQKLNTQ